LFNTSTKTVRIQGAAAPSFYTRSIFTAQLIWRGRRGRRGKGEKGEGRVGRKGRGRLKLKIARSAKICNKI